MTTSIRCLVAVTVASMLVLTGCSRSITGTAVIDASASTTAEGQCATVDAPLEDIPVVHRDEPRLRIPVPAGWKQKDLPPNSVTRYAIIAPDLVANSFAPNTVVTLETVPGKVAPEDVFDQNRASLVHMLGAFDLVTTKNTTCDLPSETTTYTAPKLAGVPQRPIIMHAVVASTADATYLATLSIQTTNGSNPTYRHDAKLIVDGFEVLLP